MRIYSKVVIDIETGEVREAEFTNYDGIVALCKGGGDQVTTTVDPEYNRGMLALYRLASDKGVEYDNLFKYGVLYNPEETQEGMMINGKWVAKDDLTPEQIGGDKFIINPDYKEGRWVQDPLAVMRGGQSQRWEPGSGPDTPKYILNPHYNLEEKNLGELYGYNPGAQISEMQLMENQIASQNRLLGSREDLERSQIETDLRLLPSQEKLQQQQIDTELNLNPLRADTEAAALRTQQAQAADVQQVIAERAPIRTQFFNESRTGIDAGRRMDQAQAEVQHAYDSAGRDLRRQLDVAQVNPGDPAYAKLLSANSLEKSKSIAAARTAARDATEDENFKRLALASSYGV